MLEDFTVVGAVAGVALVLFWFARPGLPDLVCPTEAARPRSDRLRPRTRASPQPERVTGQQEPGVAWGERSSGGARIRHMASPQREVVVAGPLLETKLFVPRWRRGLVPRPRLSERLDRGAEAKLTLVSAPAGFGKTTLLAEWLAAVPAGGRAAAWLSLDPSDNDPASFWTYVIAALRTAAPGVGAGALALLQAPQPPPIDAVLATLLNELGARRARRRARARRLPRHRRPRGPDGAGLPARPSAPAAAPGDRQPRRSGAAAGPPARAGRPRRDPRRRPALHARGGRGVPQRA